LSVEQKLKILKDILGPFQRSSDERLFTCPKCKHHKPKLSVNIEKDSFKCWICDFKAPAIYRLIRRYGTFQQRSTWEELTGKFDLSNAPADLAKIIRDIDKKQEKEEEQVITLPKEFKTLTGSSHHVSSFKAKKYLSARGITKEDILKWKIGYCSTGDYEDRVIVPSFNMDGKVNYFIARSYGDDWMKYKNPPAKKDVLFNELYVDWENDVVLVEGVFDAIVAGNAVPLMGSTLREDSVLFSKIVQNDTPLFVALDPDAESKAMKLVKKLVQYGCEVFKIDVSGYDDVGSMPRETFEERKKNATEMDLDESFLVHALRAV
tara:strand:- start:10269 stop:11228 length:960 start_codon:yes stop_codon:yes gene_type:complete